MTTFCYPNGYGNAYGQTLFLGCTVKSYNCSLAWGGEASRLQVELIQDSCDYPVLYGSNGTAITRPSTSSYNDYSNSRSARSFSLDENGNPLVPGKVYYVPYGSSLASKYYYGADPGFYGNTIDLMGIPVFFKHDNFEFNGIIQSYENSGGQGGTKTYTVIIEGPSNLLNNVSMILSDYHGSVFRLPSGSLYGFPAYVDPTASEFYHGSIAQQNIPNAINVFGYLESTGFGNSGRNEEGLPSLNIIEAIDDLLSTAAPIPDSILKFSSFGRILSRVPTLVSNGSAITSSYDNGIIYPGLDIDSIYRMPIAIDLTELMTAEAQDLLQYYRISATSMSIREFIDNICNSIGKQFFCSLNLNISGGNFYPTIKINTISTLGMTQIGAVDSFISYASSLGTVVSSYQKGKSYNATDPVRTMIVGGKQQRMYQVKNTKYASKTSTLRYNALNGQFIDVNHFGSLNYYKYPNINSTRNPSFDYASPLQEYYGRVEVPSSIRFSGYDTTWQSTYSPIYGNFTDTDTVLGGVGTLVGDYSASDADAICPYFGNDLLTKLVRKVYCSSAGMFKVGFTRNELGTVIGYKYSSNSTIKVSETEIRAAMEGLDSYAGLISAIVKDGPSGSLDIWDNIIFPIVGRSGYIMMTQGISQNYNKYNSSRPGSNSVATGQDSNYTDNPVLRDILQKLQKFFGDIGNEYYGKKFMVSVPDPEYWVDSAAFSPAIQIGTNDDSSPRYLTYGTNKYYFSYEPTDGGWEEAGNVLDDSLVVGSSSLDVFTQDNGLIEPIIGFNNGYQVNYQRLIMNTWWNTYATTSTPQNFFNFWKWDAFTKKGGGSFSTDPLYNALNSSYEPLLDLSKGDRQSSLTVSVPYSTTDAFGTAVPQTTKLYVKASVDKELQTYVATYPSLKTSAKVILTIDPVYINSMYSEALNVNVAAVEYLMEHYISLGSPISNVAKKIMALTNLWNTDGTISAGNQDTDNKQYNNISIAPRAAMPAYAAVPILFNNAVYGPWVSAPDRASGLIFNDNHLARLENLVGGAKIEVNPDLVPWNYGGMRVLDEAALQLVGSENNYNIITEQGSLVTYGLPIVNLGDELKAAGDLFNGPTVNNINVQIGESGPTTTYSFRTFTRKFTLFNKENADRLREAAQNTHKLNRELNKSIQSVKQQMLSISNSTSVNYNTYTRPKLNAYSPSMLLVGHSRPYISPMSSGSPGLFKPGSWTKDSLKRTVNVTLQELRESPQEYQNLYSSKSMMSLDGLLSPVSFYPTIYDSTKPFKKYLTAYCPMCMGTKSYTENGQTKYCFYCENTSSITSSTGSLDKYNSSSVYLLSSQANSGTTRNLSEMSGLIEQMRRKQIGFADLNPLIMPVGELRNRFAQSGDYNAHNVEYVARSLVPMSGSLSFSENLAISQSGYELLDQNNSGSFIDWNSYAFDIRAGLIPKQYLTNYRFLALKGPLVLNGWGFDTEGFPIPNSSGDPLLVNASGNPLKITSKMDQSGTYDPSISGVILGKNQIWVSGSGWTDPYKEQTFASGWGLRPDTWAAGPIDLRWNEERKVWSAPQPKFISVRLEDNLNPTFAARGYINLSDSRAPLASGEKRLVFVKDSTESYGAPSGVKLLCYYDENLGYYEPISKEKIVTSGIVTGFNQNVDISGLYFGKIYSTGTMKLYDTYINPGSSSPSFVSGVFSNPLGLGALSGQNAMFTYEKNSWILSNINNTSITYTTTGVWGFGSTKPIYMLPSGSPDYYSNYITAYNNYATIPSGKWCSISLHQDGKYYLVSAEGTSTQAVYLAEIVASSSGDSKLVFRRNDIWVHSAISGTDIELGLAECVVPYTGGSY